MFLRMLIFFTVFSLIHTLINLYILRRGTQALRDHGVLKKIFIAFMIAVYLSSLGGMLLFRFAGSGTVIFFTIGAYWYGIMLYASLLLLLIDLARLVLRISGHDGSSIDTRYPFLRPALFGCVALFSLSLMVYGWINAREIVEERHAMIIEKDAGTLKELNCVLLSDIHIGPMLGPDRVKEIIDRVNSMNTDIVLIPGDLVDGPVEPYTGNGIGKHFRSLRSRYGVFACTGNHEFFGHADRTADFFRENGVRYLRDEFLVIEKSLVVIGREDLELQRVYGKELAPMRRVMRGVPRHLPMILLKHRPVFDEAESEKIDLQVSGHTHNGQIFPVSLITRLMYDTVWGYGKKGSTRHYVTCGVGTWGPPVRIGSRSEIVRLHITFRGKPSLADRRR